jgi:ribosomal protein S26
MVQLVINFLYPSYNLVEMNSLKNLKTVLVFKDFMLPRLHCTYCFLYLKLKQIYKKKILKRKPTSKMYCMVPWLIEFVQYFTKANG